MSYIVAVLDVESMGLYGDAFSYGIVIGDSNGNVIEEIYKYSEANYKYAKRVGKKKDVDWIEVNVTPHLGESNSEELTRDFIYDWIDLNKRYPNIKLFADVPFPVETNFITLARFIINDAILDVTSFRLARNLPDYYERLENELPIHNALNDARQSYRGLVQVIGN
jgi:hypothetical protein